MDSNHRKYDHEASMGMLDAYLGSATGPYEESSSLPDRDDLTFNNGFYGKCTALFVDLRGSSDLPDHYKRPTLARIYRAFISECVAIMNAHPKAREVNIVGDCVWGVFNTPSKSDIQDVFSAAARVNSMMKALRYKMGKKGMTTPVHAGIGMAYGRALMVKAGYNGSGINDVVYMGDVVNRAAHLAHHGSRGSNGAHMLDKSIYINLDDHRQGLVRWNQRLGCYEGDFIRTVMEDWYKENCP
jgi:class 3 adenylate cyclase